METKTSKTQLLRGHVVRQKVELRKLNIILHEDCYQKYRKYSELRTLDGLEDAVNNPNLVVLMFESLSTAVSFTIHDVKRLGYVSALLEMEESKSMQQTSVRRFNGTGARLIFVPPDFIPFDFTFRMFSPFAEAVTNPPRVPPDCTDYTKRRTFIESDLYQRRFRYSVYGSMYHGIEAREKQLNKAMWSCVIQLLNGLGYLT